MCSIPSGVHTSNFENSSIFEDRDLQPIMERIGFRVSENPTKLIWERNDEYDEDIVTAGLFLLAGTHKVCNCQVNLVSLGIHLISSDFINSSICYGCLLYVKQCFPDNKYSSKMIP